MKLSSKLKRKLKKRLLTGMSSIAVSLAVIASISSIAGFSASTNSFLADLINTDGVSETAESVDVSMESAENMSSSTATAYSTRLTNTSTKTYIYDVNDLVTFRNNVNAGNTYSGKTVYLMADIDMSTVCSSSLGSWKPIGATGTTSYISFAGTFDGNYHTISNLYYSGATYQYVGLFSSLASSGVIQNVIMNNIYIYNTYSSNVAYSGGIAAYNLGSVKNCGIKSGSVISYHTTAYNACTGGIVGLNTGAINGCYNKAATKSYCSYSSSSTAWVGGIFGDGTGTAKNCYNAGTVYSYGYVIRAGGIVGRMYDTTSGVWNCYNCGSVTGSAKSEAWIAGVVALNGTTAATYGTFSNSYCTTATTYSYRTRNKSSSSTTYTTGRVEAATLKTYTVTLGSAYGYDVYSQNSGYPVLAWENETTEMKLNKNQAYIKVR